MGTTINAYSVSLGLDASNYIDSSKLSRAETNKLKRDLESARDPMEQLAVEQAKLEKAVNEGAIAIDVYNRLLDAKKTKLLGDSDATREAARQQQRLNDLTDEGERLTRKLLTADERLAIEKKHLNELLRTQSIGTETYNRAIAEAEKRAGYVNGQKIIQAELVDSQLKRSISTLDTFSKVGNVITGIRQGLMLVGDAVRFVTDKFEAFNSVTNAIDDANDAAKKLGLSFNELGSLQFAASRLGGGDAAGAIDKALGQMLKKGLVEPGESAVDAFKRVADQVQQAATQTERAQIAADAFGKSGIEILAVLQSGSAEIENLVSQWEKTNALSDEQLAGIEEYNDRWDDVVQSVTGIRNLFFAELAPAMTTMSEQAFGIDTSFQSVTEQAREIVDHIVSFVGVVKDLNELAEAPMGIATLLEGDIGAKWSAALEFDSASKMLDALDDRRTQLRKDAHAEELKRMMMRNDIAKDGIEEVSQKQLDAIKTASDALTDELEKQWIQEMKLSDAALARDLSAAEKKLSVKSTKPTMASLDVGSAEAIKYLAELANAGQESKPTEEEILAEAVKQREIMEQQRINDEVMKQKLQELIEVSKENGFKRIR